MTGVNAVVMIKAETSSINELAEQLAELPGVAEVFSVAGQYDLVALVRVRENEELAFFGAGVNQALLLAHGFDALDAERRAARGDVERDQLAFRRNEEAALVFLGSRSFNQCGPVF